MVMMNSLAMPGSHSETSGRRLANCLINKKIILSSGSTKYICRVHLNMILLDSVNKHQLQTASVAQPSHIAVAFMQRCGGVTLTVVSSDLK